MATPKNIIDNVHALAQRNGVVDQQIIDYITVPHNIDGISYNATEDISHYAICSTRASVAEKAVSVPKFNLVEGGWLAVKWLYTNTALNPKLKVNDAESKFIKYKGANVEATYLVANTISLLLYDGIAFEYVGNFNDGRADSADILHTARYINNTLFDGSEDIITECWGLGRNIKISDASNTNKGTAILVDGSTSVTLPLPSIIEATLQGNAATTSMLLNAVNINNTLFDGSENITTNEWGVFRDITISDADNVNTGMAISVNGAEDVTLKLPSTIKADITGNSDTATILRTTRKINNTEFNGGADIITTQWGTGRNIYIKDADNSNTSAAVFVDGATDASLVLPSTIKASIVGNASTATTLQTTRTIAISGGVTGTATNFNGSTNITIPVTTLDVSKASAGTLAVNRGGTGVTTINEIKAGKDASGNTITTTYAPLVSPALTGTPTTPTPAAGTNTTQIASTAFVESEIDRKMTVAQALVYNGKINSISELPAKHTAGWTYGVGTAGTYAGQVCEVGDLIICNTSGTTANNNHWDVYQKNIDGAVVGPATAVANQIPIFDGTTGKIIKDSGYNINNINDLFIGASDGTANAVTTNGNTYLILKDGTSYIRRNIKGTGDVSVTSDANGTISVNCDNTKVSTTLNTTTKAYLLGTTTTPTATATAVTAIADTGVYLNNAAGELVTKTLRSDDFILTSVAEDTTRTLLSVGIAKNDYFKINVGGSSDAGYVELMTGDNGNEPIYIKQYNNSASSYRTLTLLDGSGNTTFPGTITATGFSGPISGNASTASTLDTARKINNTNFDGSADITTALWGTARNISIKDADGTNTGTAVSVNGSTAATLILPAIIKASLTGNASTATTLQTARKINGTNFNGSADITTDNWGTARNISIADSDSTNTGMAISVNGAEDVTLKLPSTIKATLQGNANSSTIVSSTPAGTSWVAGVTANNAVVTATTTGYGAIWNAPTKNYRVGCSTYPSSNDLVYLCYSVTNANVTANTNTVAKQLAWSADTGILTATGFSGPLTGNVTGNCSGSSGSCTGNADTATKVNNNFVIKLKSGTTEGTDLYTFNGSAAKTLDIKQGSNVTLTAAAGSLTIAATDTVYTHPTTSGNKHIPSGGSSGQILRWSADGTAVWGADNNTTYNASSWANMFGATVAVSNSAIDVSTGSVFTKTISAATTFTFSGVPSGRAGTFSILLTNGGKYTVKWPSSVKWADGLVPTLSSSGTDLLTFITGDGGTTWYGVVSSIKAS